MYFIYNNYNSNDLGLILPDTTFRPSWAEAVDDIRIPGRASNIKQPTGNYDNQTLTVNAVISDTANINTIYAALSGQGRLILSTAPNEYINVRVLPLIPKGVALDMAELPIQFDCFPFAYALQPTEVALTTTYQEVVNSSTVYSAPIIKIECNEISTTIRKGDVNFDGKVTPVDASLVLQEYNNIIAGEPTFTAQQNEAADVNNDGNITAVDASLILQMCNGTIPIPDPIPVDTELTISTNGEDFKIGIPAEVLSNGFDVYLDCGRYIVYYWDRYTNSAVNILQYSEGDLPLLRKGQNFMKYSVNTQYLVKSITVSINERWL